MVAELSPATASYWGVLATVHQKMKNYDEAIKAGGKTVELADENRKAYFRGRLDSITQPRQTDGGQPKGGKRIAR